MFRFEELEIWKLSVDYGNELYDISWNFPSEEKYSLGDQLRRAAVSISNNIAEGSGSTTKKNFAFFLDISVKSAFETVNILYFAEKRNYINPEKRKKLYDSAEVLIKRIRAFKNSLY